MPDSATYRNALSERSSYVENILIHRLVAELAGELWQRDPTAPLSILNSEVDDAGFDLVITDGSHLRYIQIKQAHLKSAARKFSIRLDFAYLPGSCVVVVVYSESDLTIDHYLFFGGPVDKPMPDIACEQASVSPIRRGKDGKKKVRAHYRDIPRRKFSGPLSITGLLDVLFSTHNCDHPIETELTPITA